MITHEDVKGLQPMDAADLVMSRYPLSARRIARAKSIGAHTRERQQYWRDVLMHIERAERLDARGPCFCCRCR